MSGEFVIKLAWKAAKEDFSYAAFSRNHTLTFPSGQQLETTAAVAYKGDPNLTNPEELLAAALASCHMLSFLAVASMAKVNVAAYTDETTAVLAKNSDGKLAITTVTMRPRVKLREPVDAEKFAALHHKAHANCFIANSVKCELVLDPRTID